MLPSLRRLATIFGVAFLGMLCALLLGLLSLHLWEDHTRLHQIWDVEVQRAQAAQQQAAAQAAPHAVRPPPLPESDK